MSLPRELLDELLSGYMDGELSADETARVDQMLAADPAARELLQRLREQSLVMRDALRKAPRLDSGFADRVLAATFAEAERRELDRSHPVRRAAAAALGGRSPSRYRQRYLVGGLAIAASLAMAAIFLTNQDADDVIATVDPPAVPTPADPGNGLAGAQANDGAPTAELATPERSAAEGLAEGAASVPAASELAEALPITPGDGTTASGGGSAAAEAPVLADSPMLADSTSQPTVEALGSEAAIAAAADNPQPAAGQAPLRAVLVYEVQLTSVGRERKVINRALREAQIRAAEQRAVDDALVGYLRNGGMIGESRAEDGGVSIMYLEGSGRRLEKLMLTLLAAREEVQSVGFSLAMDPPVLAAVDSLRQIEPIDIRSEAVEAVAQSLSLEGMAGGASFTAGDRSYFPLQPGSLEMISAMGSMSGSDQPDITASTFLIIR